MSMFKLIEKKKRSLEFQVIAIVSKFGNKFTLPKSGFARACKAEDSDVRRRSYR